MKIDRTKVDLGLSAFGFIANALTRKGWIFTEDDEGVVAMTVRVPASVKKRIEGYSASSGISQTIIARHLLEGGLDKVDEILIALKTAIDEENEKMCIPDKEHEELAQKKQAEALEALKSIRR